MVIAEYDQCDCGKRGPHAECEIKPNINFIDTIIKEISIIEEITKEMTFRSNYKTNITDNMVKVELVLTRNNWRKIKKMLQNIGVHNHAKKE